MKLVSVHTSDAQPDQIRIQWNMGNSCNYACEYCPPILHNGSRQWIDTDKSIEAVKKISAAYEKTNQNIHWDLIGGEVTVMPGFNRILKTIYDSNSTCSVFTNGSRTVEWWKKNKKFITTLTITFHPQTATQEHFINVLNEVKDSCSISVQLAGAKGHLADLLKFRHKLVTDVIPESTESVHIKRLYNKKLGGSGSQDSFYAYSDHDEEILNMSFVKVIPQPDNQELIVHTVKERMTEFTYSNQQVDQVKTKDIKHLKLNSFKGMYCKLGSTMLSIDFAGNVWGSWCGAKKLGNISDVNNIAFSIKPQICDVKYCNNENDLLITKFR